MEGEKNVETKAALVEGKQLKAVDEERESAVEEDCNSKEEFLPDSEEDYNFTEEVELPEELRSLKEMSFPFEEHLEEELWRRGFAHLPVVLDPASGKARLKLRTEAQSRIAATCAKAFDIKWKGIASAGSSAALVYIQRAEPGRKIYTREPDIAFWGPDKTENVHVCGETISLPSNLDQPPKRFSIRDQVARVNPDVVIQFSWRNEDSYEEKAIDDMMNFALVSHNLPQAHNSPPKLGYLIKIRFKATERSADDRLILRAIEVYRIPQGATVKDAVKNVKGATCSRYTPGGPDVVIRVTPQDLRIPLGTYSPSTFEMHASAIFRKLS